MNIDYNLIILMTFYIFFIGRMYSLRNQSAIQNSAYFGWGVGFATFMYGFQTLILIAYFVLNFINGEWISPFIILLIAFVAVLIMSKILVLLKVITPFSPQISPIMMTFYGFLTLCVDCLIIINLLK